MKKHLDQMISYDGYDGYAIRFQVNCQSIPSDISMLVYL